jgi:hypothetical protein
MAKEKYLKSKNMPVVVIFIAWCVAVYIGFLSYPAGVFEKLMAAFKEQHAKDSIVTVLSPILILILTGIISSGNKARLVFWRIDNALPGHRAFSKLAPGDPRIDMQKLIKKMGDALPEDPKEQNSKWYSIYKQYADSVIVLPAHKNFLLARDLCSIALLFAVFGPCGLIFSQPSVTGVLVYSLLMFMHYVVLAIVARNHGNRFVCNVLVEYINDSKAGPSPRKRAAKPPVQTVHAK